MKFVIESDADGPTALPLRLDQDDPSPGRYSATTRVTRMIYRRSALTDDRKGLVITIRTELVSTDVRSSPGTPERTPECV